MMQEENSDSGMLIGQFPCDCCGSKDNLSIYKHDDGTFTGLCWGVCRSETGSGYFSNNTLSKSSIAEELGIKYKPKRRRTGKTDDDGKQEEKVVRKVRNKDLSSKIITEKEKQRIKDNTSATGKGFRGIENKILKRHGVLTAFDEETGEVSDRYYPITMGKVDDKPKLVGYHRRFVLPEKDFRPVGLNSKECELFGQWRCKGNGKLVLTGGQEDKLAAEQMFESYREERGRDKIKNIDFVSGTVGETSLASQIRYNYDFIDGYDEIIIDMDADDAGENATKALLEVLPLHKVKVMRYDQKDANDALEEGNERGYVSAIYDARKPKLTGTVSGEDMWNEMIKSVSKPLIPLPPMLKPLESKLCGGLPVAEIINILAASGVGKTSITNALIMYWLFECPYKMGILSMEAGAGKFLVRLVSGYLKKNIARLQTPEDKIKFLEDNKERCYELFFTEDGEERFYLVDDNGDLDTLSSIKRAIERMIVQGQCEVIIIDPIQDALDSLSVEEQAAFVGWQKKMKARYKTTFININHTRKSGGGKKAGSQGGELTEEDMQGSSALYKSGAVNIILTRDKTNEDPEVRNTTKIMLFKARDTGETGQAGEIYYEVDSATLHNKEDWVKYQSCEEGF